MCSSRAKALLQFHTPVLMNTAIIVSLLTQRLADPLANRQMLTFIDVVANILSMRALMCDVTALW